MATPSKFRYSCSQAGKNISRNKMMSIASLFTICCCLIILGFFTIISLNVNYITEQVKDRCEIQLYINQGTPQKRVEAIKNEILSNANVKDAQFMSRHELFEHAKKDFFKGREDLVGDYTEEDNPFDDSYKITLHDISKSKETTQELSKLSDVDHIENQQNITNLVFSVSRAVKSITLIVMIILFIISVVIISNTVRLTVFNRRKEINIMKFIGATDRFIRTPFIIEGVLIGFLGAVISFGLTSWGYIVLYNKFTFSEFNVFNLVPYTDIYLSAAILFVVFGCFIGILGSTVSMKKYLKV